MQTEYTPEAISEYRAFSLPRFDELPDIGLYMDQVLSIIDNALGALIGDGEGCVVTSTMVNNYVKQRVVMPPEKKRYTRTHLAYLIVVCVLKQLFSIQEVYELITVQVRSASIKVAYNCFCEEIEDAIHTSFCGKLQYSEMEGLSPERRMLRAAAVSFAGKVYVERLFVQNGNCEQNVNNSEDSLT